MSAESPTILVVDDEPLVRQFLYDILTRDGYTVLEGHHADHALHLCQQHSGPIHLLLTDIHMPDMNGRELARPPARLASTTPGTLYLQR